MQQQTVLLCWLAFFATLVTAENPNPPAEAGNTTQSYRLPNETYPIHYYITITMDVHKGETSFQGDVIIDIVIAKATRKIVLHSRELEISKVAIGSEYTEWEELSNEYESNRQFLTLKRKNSTEFPPDTKWKLAITYSGELRNDGKGFGFYKYLDDEGKNHYLAATLFYSTNARYAFPCYDEPAKLANFTITVNHSPSYTAVSNMPVNQNLSSANKTVFLTTPRISTCLVAFVVSDMEYTELTFKGIRQRVYSRPSLKPDHKWPVFYSTFVFEYISEYTGIEFMLPKLDHVVIPDYTVLAMAHSGLITHSEGSFKYNKVNEVAKLIASPYNIAYTISAQWLASITSEWWDYFWVEGSLSNLFAIKALDNTFPDTDVWQQTGYIHFYENELSADSHKPLSSHVESPKELHLGSGYSVLHMWNHAVTDKVFRKAIQKFLKKNQYSTVGEQELFTAIQNAAEEESYGLPAKIEEMMSTWTHQNGYPLLTITRNYEDGTFNIKQEAFVADEPDTDVKTWHIPINFAVASNPDFRDTQATHYLLNINESKVDAGISKTDWLVVNKQSTGFYRIKYDEENYKMITECLIERPFLIHYRNRAQLLGDAYHLTISKRLDYSILLKMLTYLKHEDRFAPWKIAGTIIDKLSIYLEENEDYKLFVAEVVGPIFNKLGVDEIAGESLNDKMTRTQIVPIACAAGVKECLVETNNKLKALIKENATVEPTLTWAIKANGLILSGDEEFDFFYQQLIDSTDSLRKESIEILGFSRNKTHLRKLLNSSIDKSNNFTIQDRIDVLLWTSFRSKIGLLACIEFLNENWEVYGNLKEDSYETYPLDKIIREIAHYPHVVNESAREKLLDLVAKVQNSEYVKSDLETVVTQNIEDKTKWFKEHIEPAKLWIEQYHATHRNDVSPAARTA